MSLQRARELRFAGVHAEAMALLRSLPDQGDIGVLRERLMNHFSLRQIDELLEVTAQIGAIDPAFTGEAMAHCGLLLRGLGRRAESIDYFRSALTAAATARSKAPAWLYSEYSGVLIDQGRWSEALAIALAGICVNPALNLTVARAHIRLGAFAAAHDALRSALPLLSQDQTRQSVFLSLATDLWMQDNSAEARSWICAMPMEVCGERAAHLETAERAVASADAGSASAIWLRVAAEHHSLRPFVMRRITEVVRAEPRLLQEFSSVHEGILAMDPTGQRAVFAYYEYLVGFMTHEAAIALMLSFQVRTPRLLAALTVELVRWGVEAKIRDLARAQLDAWQRSTPYLLCSRFFDAMCRFQPLKPDWLEPVRALPHCLWQLYFLFRLPHLKSLGVWGTSDVDAAQLCDAGLNVPALREFMDGILRIPPLYDGYLGTAETSCAEATQKIRDDECFVTFQDRVVTERNFSMIDPFTGKRAVLLDSLKIYDRQLFSFSGSELVLAISGGNMNAIAFLFLPSINILIPVEKPGLKCSQNYYGSSIHMADLFAVYLARVANHYHDFIAAAVQAPQSQELPRKIVVIHGRAENPAHHSWNYLSAFERLNMAGLLGNIDAVVRPPTEYFGDLRALFAQLKGVEILDLPERPSIDPQPFSVNHVVLQLGGNFITRGLKTRLQQWAVGQVPAPTVESAVEHRHAVVWLGLRVGDKVWTNQEAGLTAVIDELCARRPGTVFLLDGFSVPHAGAPIPAKWLPAYTELRELATRIKAKVLHPAAVIDLIGGTLADALVWAMNTTLYFTPVGSSQHKIGWYSDCPGIVYSSVKLEAVRRELRPGAWEAEGSAVPEYMLGSVADAGRRRGHFDFRTNLENIELPAAEVAGRMLKLLDTLSPDR